LFVPAHVLPLAHPRHSVVTVHDLGYHYFPEAHTAAQRAYLEWSTRFAVQHAAQFIAVSQATKNDLVRLYAADARKVSVVHHGVEREIRGDQGRSGEIMGDRPRPVSPASVSAVVLPARYLLAIGTIQPRKNYARLIEAYASLVLKPDEVALV